MSSESVKVSVILRKRGFAGVVTVFNDGLHIWSETTPRLRSTMAEALKDAENRRAHLMEHRR